MRFFRQASPHGRPSIAGRLDFLKKAAPTPDQWDRFMVLAIPWMGARRTPGLSDDRRLLAVTATPETARLETALQWLYREQKRDDYLLQNRNDLQTIRDYFLGARPDLMKLTGEQALTAANEWHAAMFSPEALNAAEGVEAPGWLLLRKFPTVLLKLEKGYTWRESNDLSAIRQVGRILGHCYRQLGFAHSYTGGGNRLFVLFTHVGNPLMSVQFRSQDEPPKFGEVRAAQNTRPEDWLGKYTTPLGEKFLGVDSPYQWGEAQKFFPMDKLTPKGALLMWGAIGWQSEQQEAFATLSERNQAVARAYLKVCGDRDYAFGGAYTSVNLQNGRMNIEYEFPQWALLVHLPVAQRFRALSPPSAAEYPIELTAESILSTRAKIEKEIRAFEKRFATLHVPPWAK